MSFYLYIQFYKIQTLQQMRWNTHTSCSLQNWEQKFIRKEIQLVLKFICDMGVEIFRIPCLKNI